jgi:hypothetical protein
MEYYPSKSADPKRGRSILPMIHDVGQVANHLQNASSPRVSRPFSTGVNVLPHRVVADIAKISTLRR